MHQRYDAPMRTTVTFEPDVAVGRPLIPNLDNIAEVLAVAEGEEYR